MRIENSVAPPPARETLKRITDEIRGMKPGESFLCDYGLMMAFRAFCRYNDWVARQQKLGEDSYRVWRVA